MVPISRLPSVPGLSSLAEATAQLSPFSDLAQEGDFSLCNTEVEGGGGGGEGISVMMS